MPADARLLRAVELRINEATLTGEAFPVDKSANAILPAELPLAERSNLVFCGTTAVSGGGRAVVFATGSQTEIGRIGQLVAAIPDEKTPLERKLDGLGRRLALVTLGIAGLVFGVGWLRGYPPSSCSSPRSHSPLLPYPKGCPLSPP
jgi:Ca2+-transporting ATPase